MILINIEIIKYKLFKKIVILLVTILHEEADDITVLYEKYILDL